MLLTFRMVGLFLKVYASTLRTPYRIISDALEVKEWGEIDKRKSSTPWTISLVACMGSVTSSVDCVCLDKCCLSVDDNKNQLTERDPWWSVCMVSEISWNGFKFGLADMKLN